MSLWETYIQNIVNKLEKWTNRRMKFSQEKRMMKFNNPKKGADPNLTLINKYIKVIYLRHRSHLCWQLIIAERTCWISPLKLYLGIYLEVQKEKYSQNLHSLGTLQAGYGCPLCSSVKHTRSFNQILKGWYGASR